MISNLLKKPSFWAVATPILFACWSLHAAIIFHSSKAEATHQLSNASQARRSVEVIRKAEQEMGITDGAGSKYFSGFSSALQCAKTSQIQERLLSRGESAKPQLQKDGSFLHRETYILNGIYLFQLAKFIDLAERNYFSVQCAQLTLSPTGGKLRDSWTASVRLEYITR